ncbi:MAG: hypothetical protein ACLPXB_18115 [Thiobacillaceae bacterium]
MSKLKLVSALFLVAVGAAVTGPVSADFHGHGYGHVGVGVVVDPFWFGPWGYPGPYYYPPYSPYYYPPAVMTAPAAPPVYVEQTQGPAPAAQPAAAAWYYCTNPQGYYPYVQQCPGGWKAVAPQPPGPPNQGQ